MSMDIISYGVANKAASDQKKTRDTTLGAGVEGQAHNLKERIDLAEKYIQGVVRLADSIIVKDTINIMKANARLNVIAKSKRYKLANMVFEDFLDDSGIDAAKSTNFSLDITLGKVSSVSGTAVITSTAETADAVPSKAILVTEENMPQKTPLIPTMISNIRPIPYVASAYDQTYSSNQAWMAFDETSNYFMGGVNAKLPYWLMIDLGTNAEAANQLEIITTGYGTPQGGLIQGSMDGKTFENLATLPASMAYYRTYLIDFVNTVKYRYYRLIQTTSGLNRMEVNKMQLYKVTSEGAQVGKYFISRDDGVTWEPINPGELFYFGGNTPAGTKIRTRIEMPDKSELLNYGLTWS
ncbi:hypothetical protein TCA2_4561 [Paenibacillus sp. TCA20]|uniref:hypothetical protein n=1 Tax=Paenibacillus sp. TCA20 TaxID=1499968 RepID=UPI0004D71758|nr:hypothetical protein [Paenibacillus sp. TCA20]GAK42069.1 hypothetical protein TCA2_4561 [Paenibacillus sp. TCA20]